MLDDFSLVDKRQVIRYEVDWGNHMVVTTEKNPSHIILNIDRLIIDGPDSYEVLCQEVWDYINPASSSTSSL